MTEATDVEVIAYVDGCLDGPALAAFEERLRNEPALAEQVAAHRWLTGQIVSAFGPPPGDEIDPALVRRLGLASDNVVPFAPPVARTRRPLLAFLASCAIAASLLVGVSVGRWMDDGTAHWLRSGPDAKVVADGALAEGLSGNLAGQSGEVRIGMSFRTAQGVCRTFSTGSGLSGMGCRQGSEWVVPIVVTGTAAASGGDYRLAAGDVAPAVMAEVDRRIVGEPLGPAEEQALRQKDWAN